MTFIGPIKDILGGPDVTSQEAAYEMVDVINEVAAPEDRAVAVDIGEGRFIVAGTVNSAAIWEAAAADARREAERMKKGN